MSSYQRFDNNNDSIEEPDDKEEIKENDTQDINFSHQSTETSTGSLARVDYDHIEVSLEDPSAIASATDEDSKEILERANDFFLEYNDNYTMNWKEAIELDQDLEVDPSKPPQPGWNPEYIKWRLRRVVESLWFRSFTFLLIFVDVILVIIDLVDQGIESKHETFTEIQKVDLIFTCWFVIELILRIIALTPQIFFVKWYNIIDFMVVLITFIIAIAAATTDGEWAEKLAILTLFRFVRLVRLIRICTERKQLETATRQLISQNKRRYQQDGYDLDLTYVTKRVIATSFPSSGILALYRNPIERVAKFLNEKHPRKYRMYNLCSERTYDTHHFIGCTVERIMIDDHNVPSLEDMIRFAKSVKEWLKADPENVIVVHCKGGKGRTGTMICVWLVEAGVFSSATESLDYFGNRRTDTNVSKKFQGVETPSQSRYVGYYEMMMNNGGQLPSPRPITITKIIISGMMSVGKGNGDDFWFNVDRGRKNQVFSAHIGYRRNCKVDYNSEKDILTIQLLNCPQLDGDIRVLFQTDNKVVPKSYENAPFYFWFNTAFVGNRLFLTREELDNPHKPKTWHCFRENFTIELMFQDFGNEQSC